MANRFATGLRLVLAVCFLVSVAWLGGKAQAQAVIDEARQVKRSAQSFPAADEDYFRGMDGGIALSPDEVKGRNMWIVWTGGDDRLWDEVTNLTFGNFDLLKILSSYPGLKYSRDNRWEYFGLVNEPCFSKATGPNPQRYGLWFDVRDPNCPADPFENADIASQMYYAKWRADRLFLLLPAGALVQQWLKTLAEFPPRQSPEHWSVGDVL